MGPKLPARRRYGIGIAAAVGFLLVTVVLGVELPRLLRTRALIGSVLIANQDPRKQLPIPNVEISAEAGGTVVRAQSDTSGYFRMVWPARIWPGEKVTLRFRHADYRPLEITQPLTNQLYIARMLPSTSAQELASHGTSQSIGNIRVRYSVKAIATVTVGSMAKTLEVVNTGNVPCEGRPPCSPDGNWKAATGSLSLSAGEGREFQNVRVSCIAGPCPFTKIESDGFARGGSKIDVAVRAWSDTVTFLVEAEVVHTMLSDAIRRAYPSFFDRNMTFTLPPTGQGPSIEAEVNGTQIVFPLGPDLDLSWATCSVQAEANATKLYACKLKPGYRFADRQS